MSGDKRDRSVTTVNLEDDLREWMDEQNYNRSDFINESIRMRKDGEQRMDALIREHKIREIKADLKAKESLLEELEEERAKDQDWDKVELEEAKQALEHTPKEPDNPAIQKKAKQLGMSPQQLIDQLEGDSE